MKPIDYSSRNWLAMTINNRVFKEHARCVRGRVLDLGCGDSPYRPEMLEHADEYIGVDWEPSYHENAHVDVWADLTEGLPFGDGYADTIVSFNVLEHLPEPALFLRECHRVLKEDGTLFLTTPFMWGIHEAPHDYYRYTRYGLRYLLEEAGFRVVEIKENTGFWQAWLLRFNYHSARFARGLLKYPFVALWFVLQIIAPVLDMVDRDPGETGGYAAIGVKPGPALPATMGLTSSRGESAESL